MAHGVNIGKMNFYKGLLTASRASRIATDVWVKGGIDDNRVNQLVGFVVNKPWWWILSMRADSWFVWKQVSLTLMIAG